MSVETVENSIKNAVRINQTAKILLNFKKVSSDEDSAKITVVSAELVKEAKRFSVIKNAQFFISVNLLKISYI